MRDGEGWCAADVSSGGWVAAWEGDSMLTRCCAFPAGRAFETDEQELHSRGNITAMT